MPWERVKLRWQHALFTVSLAVPTASVLTPPRPELGLIAALIAWYAYWFGIRRDPTPTHLPYLIGASMLWAVMAATDPGLLGIGVAVLIPHCLNRPRWAAVAFVVLAAVWLAQHLILGDAM